MTSLWRCEMNIFTHMWTNIKRIFSHIWEFLFCSPTQYQQYCERGAIFGQKASTLYRLEINCLQWTLQFGKAKFRHKSFLDQKQHFFVNQPMCSVSGERGENDKTLNVQISCFFCCTTYLRSSNFDPRVRPKESRVVSDFSHTEENRNSMANPRTHMSIFGWKLIVSIIFPANY